MFLFRSCCPIDFTVVPPWLKFSGFESIPDDPMGTQPVATNSDSKYLNAPLSSPTHRTPIFSRSPAKRQLLSRKSESVLNTAASSSRQSISTTAGLEYGGLERPVPNTELKLAVLGGPKVGKTALVSQFLWRIFPIEYIPTVEEFQWIEYELNGGLFMLQIIDTSGSHDFLGMRKLYEQTSDAFLLVFSVNDPDSFEEVKQIYTEIKSENKKTPPILLIANKIDLLDDDDWLVPRADVTGFVSENRCPYVETSAKDTTQVEQVFRQLLQQKHVLNSDQSLKARRQSLPASMSNSGRKSAAALSKSDIKRLQEQHLIAQGLKKPRESCTIS